MDKNDNLITVNNLSKTYELSDGSKKIALDNLNIEVKEGEILGIIGMSGSGKSSLVRILRGVEKFDTGTINLDGTIVEADSENDAFNQLKKKTSIHLQRSFGLWPETVLTNVVRKLYGAKYGDETATILDAAHKEFDEEAMEILKAVNLEHKYNHYALVLSGGEKQRLILARQMAKKPKVLLLDEPATMSCPKTKQDTLDAIKKINKMGVTIVLVSHLPEVHRYLSDRLVLIEEGKNKKEGEVEDVLNFFLKDIDEIESFSDEKTIFDDNLVKVRNVNKEFILMDGGKVLKMKDINFDIYRNEILTLMGPSGAGKTVLLRIVTGLDLADSGDVYFKLDNDYINMHEPSIERLEIRKKLGIMHQEFALAPKATIRDQIAAKLGVKEDSMVRKARAKAKKLGYSDEFLDLLYQLTDLPESEAKNRLEQIDMDPSILNDLFPSFPEKEAKKFAEPIFKALDLPMEILNRKSEELSGGQKVRSTLAIVLAAQPDYLFLDEPFGDLDPITLRIVTNSIKRINHEFGTTIVMISHHMDFIRELSTRAILMDHGEIVNDGEVNKLCDELIEISNARYLMVS